MSAVRVSDLAVRAGTKVLVGPLSFELPAGGTLGLRGPSGAGKSTVLRALVGLLAPELSMSGQASVLGVDITAASDLPALRAKAALVGQVPVVFPTSVLGNAMFGLRHVAPASKAELRAQAKEALVQTGLWDEVADRLDAPAAELSVGQRQRLCLARALALDPELLLLDEPTSALDDAAAAAVEDAILNVRKRRAVLVVSHDQAQLNRLCGEVVSLPGRWNGDGR